MNKIFDGVAGNHPGLNRFDCSYSTIMSAKIGLLYPVQCDEVVPGDVFKMSAACHCEVQPLVAPLMCDLQIFAHAFFVPYRLIYGVDNSDGQPIWEKYITGGKDGEYDTPLTPWLPNFDKTTFSSETIWDCIGNPVVRTFVPDDPLVPDVGSWHWTPVIPYGLDVMKAPKLAYNFIYNNFYRDENLIDEVDLDNEDLLNVAFKKDYFTSALEEQQRGISPAIPITGEIPVTLNLNSSGEITGLGRKFVTYGYQTGLPTGLANNVGLTSVGNYGEASNSAAAVDGVRAFGGARSSGETPLYVDLNGLGLNLSVGGSASASGAELAGVNINQLRLMFAQQRLLELSMRSGYRYTEYLAAHFGVSPTDARLDRPEYIGGCIIPISVSPQVQTSSTVAGTTPQGNKAGIASADSVQKIGNYRVLEHGLIMTMISVRPKPIYQQGIDRQWLRQTRWDHYSPEFAYLSENGIYNAELYVDGVAHEGDVKSEDNNIFGYQAAWNEMRCKNNRAVGSVREQFDFWTMARVFGSRPALNQDFIEIKDSDFNRVFAVQDEDEFIISWSNLIDAYRPLPAMGVPGLVDHVYGGR